MIPEPHAPGRPRREPGEPLRPAVDRRAHVVAAAISELPPDALLTAAEVAGWIGVHEATLANWRREGVGPARVKVGKRAHRYRKADILDWLEERIEA